MTGETPERLILFGEVDGLTLAALLATPGGAGLAAERGTDAAGRPRTVLTLTHPDPEVIALTRQNVLRLCRARGVRAFVV